MKQQLSALWAKVSNVVGENKELVIRVGGILVGAAVGAIVATAIANAQEDSLLEEVVMEELETEENNEQ